MSNLKSQEFQKLLDKFLSNEASKEDILKFYGFFLHKQKTIKFAGSEHEKKILKKRLFNKIQAQIEHKAQPDNVKTIPFYKLKWNKIAIAASIVFLLGLGYFLKTTFNKNDGIIIPEIVNQNLKMGSDKATLTLADGNEIILEKGSLYNKNNVVSNGKEIFYDHVSNSNSDNKEVAYNSLTIPTGGEYFIKLSDGTKVWLNSESKLKYPVKFVKGQSRTVELVYGEAFFEVSPSVYHGGSTFSVYIKGQEVEVLGTEFNIKAYKDEINIYTTLVEGSIALGAGNKDRIVLKPNEQSIFNPESKALIIKPVNSFYETCWRNGLFSFKSKSLEDIMKTLSRWYDAEIEFENEKLRNLIFTGDLKKFEFITTHLEMIEMTTDVKFEVDGKIIIIKQKNKIE